MALQRDESCKIFCIGMFKTGTHSIFDAIKNSVSDQKIFGYDGGWNLDYVPKSNSSIYFDLKQQKSSLWSKFALKNQTKLMEIIDTHQVFCDTPFLFIYEQICEWYPNSLFILTKRDVRKVIASDLRWWIEHGINTTNFKSQHDRKNAFMKRYNEHNEFVENFFSDKACKLFVINWENKGCLTDINKFLKNTNYGIQIFADIGKPINVSPKLAILLTLRYDKNEKESFFNLKRFANSLQCDNIANYHIFLGFEYDDVKIQESMEKIKTLFGESQITFIRIDEDIIMNKMPFPVCKVWRKLAFEAKNAGNEYEWFVFLGDDIELIGNWYEQMLKSFFKLKQKALESNIIYTNNEYKQQENIGIVCFKEQNDPNWPCFPVICRSHLDIFNEIFSNEFINQDADPYLFELYRRFGLAVFTEPVTLINHKGGVTGGLTYKEPRYQRAYFPWKTKILTSSVQKLKAQFNINNDTLIDTLDIIIPNYRINEIGPTLYDTFINKIIVPKKMDIRYVLVIDRPLNDITSKVQKILKELQHKTNIRIRVNYTNKGASYSRTRGIQECHSDFAVFLDDDVIPEKDILIELQKAIHSKQGQNSIGFVGLSILPRDGRYSTSAFHMAQTSFFWEISKHFKYVPWGVTAFVACKWAPNMKFDQDFPKTGGGEDVAFCIEHLKGAEKKIMAVPTAKVVHPWWHNAKRWPMYKRCINWAIGDGLLIDKYPQFTFYTLPNIWEMTAILLLIFIILFVLFRVFDQHSLTSLIRCYIIMFLMLWLFEFIAGIIWIYYKKIENDIVGFKRFWTAFESNFIRNSSEFGHMYGQIKRGKFGNLCKHFDWFLSTYDDAPQYEWHRSVFHFTFFVVAISITMYIVLIY